MTVMDDQIIDLILDGYDTAPKITCKLMGLPYTEPKTLSYDLYCEYTNLYNKIIRRLQKLLKWHDIEIAGGIGIANEPRTFRVVA